MSTENIAVNDKIKELRMTKGISIEEVANQTGISASTISQIEEQKFSPPLGNIISLANFFDVSLGDFFDDSADSPFCIVRGSARETVSRFDSEETKSCGYTYEALGLQKKNRRMEPFLVTLTPLESLKLEPNQHIGEEIIFVIAGEIEVKLGDHADILKTGDSIYYDSNIPHIVSCHGDTPATILAVIYAQEEMLIL